MNDKIREGIMKVLMILILFFTLSMSVQGVSLDKLASTYRFDVSSGTVPNDVLLGTAPALSPSGSLNYSETGKIGTSIRVLAGTTSRMSSSSSNYSNNANFTVNFWVYPTSAGGGADVFVQNGWGDNGACGASNGGAWKIIWAASGLGYHKNNVGCTLQVSVYNSSHPIATYLNSWNMITLKVQNYRAEVYLNNILVVNGTDTTVNPPAAADTKQIMVGVAGVSDTHIQGRFDELSYWMQPISKDDISELYNSGLGVTYPYSIYFSITAKNNISLESIYNFTALINGTTYYSNTTTGILTTPFNTSQIFNITTNSTGYLGNLTINHNTTNNLNVYLTPSSITINITTKDKIFNTNICNFTSTIEGTTYNSNVAMCQINSTILINSLETYVYNVTTNATNYLGNISNNLNLATTQIINLTPIYNARLNITAYNFTSILSDFIATATDLNTAENISNTTTGNLSQLYLIQGHNYSVRLDKTGYAYSYYLYTPTLTDSSYRFNLTETNSIFITIRQENNSNLILNSSHTLIGNLGSTYTKSTTNGYINWTNLPADTYKDSIVSAGYSTKEYSFTIADRTTQNLTAYLNSGTALLFTVKTGLGAVIENALIKMSTFVNGTLQMVESKYTDIQGQAQFAAMNNTFYSFNITATGYQTAYFSLNPVLFTSYEVVLSETESGTYYPDKYNVVGNATYNNVTHILTYSYVSSNANLTSYYWRAAIVTKPIYTLICENISSTGLTNTYTCNLTGYTGNIYVEGVVDGYSYYGGFLDISGADSLFDDLAQKDAAFISGFIMLLIVIGGVSFGIIGTLVSGVVGILAISWLGILTPISLTFVIVAIVVSIIIAIGVRRG